MVEAPMSVASLAAYYFKSRLILLLVADRGPNSVLPFFWLLKGTSIDADAIFSFAIFEPIGL